MNLGDEATVDQGGASALDAQIARHDWAATPVGARRAWPQALRFAVDMILASAFPAFILWGRGRNLIYNEACAPLLAEKHPWALGRDVFEVWPEVELALSPVIARALEGEASLFRDLPVELVREGQPARAYFTFSYSPLGGPAGAPPGGVLCICHETTQAMEALRHTEILLGLDAQLRPLRDPTAIIAAAQATLGQVLQVSRVGYGDLDAAQRHFTTTRNWTDGTVQAHEGVHDLAAFGPRVLAALRQGVTLVVADAAKADADPSVAAAFASIEAAAMVAVSLVKDGALTAALYVHQKHPRVWTDAEVRLVEAVAERTWSAVERARAEAALRHSEARFREFFEAAGDAIFVEDAQGRYVEVNAAACQLLGYSRDELLSMAVRDVVADHDAPRVVAWRAAEGRGHPMVSSWRLRRKDGAWVDVEICARPLSDGSVEAVVRDVSQQRAEEARRELMLHELNHRVKNSLATVQAIAAQTFRGAVSAESAGIFTERLMALARANDLLVAETWRGADLARIAEDVARPFGGEVRFSVRGPSLMLPPKAATALALALHELATNAAKYGALSVPEGRVSLRWTLDAAGGLGAFALTWRETDGPSVSPPSKTGFGTRLVHGLRAELGGEVTIDYAPSGLVCAVRALAAPPSAEMMNLRAHRQPRRNG